MSIPFELPEGAMNRIAIIGCGGSGKSTLARRLGRKLQLPVHHLDRLYWQPGWTEPPGDEWRERQEHLCEGDEWIIDGDYCSTMDIRLAAADTIILLDLPRRACLMGALRRFLAFRGRTRPDMTEGCPERLDREYLKWIWNYRRDRRPATLEKLKELNGMKKTIRLTSRDDIEDFVGAAEIRPEAVPDGWGSCRQAGASDD